MYYIVYYIMVLYLMNLKSSCGKTDAFECAGNGTQVFRLPVHFELNHLIWNHYSIILYNIVDVNYIFSKFLIFVFLFQMKIDL